jgi:hypothetical protein
VALKQTLRIALDIAMTALLLFAYKPQLARETTHIYIGIAIIVLFTVHIFINRHWFETLFKGKYTPRRIGTTAINIVLVLVAVTLIISGILEARWGASFLRFEREITLRQIHTTAAYWFWPLMGVHLGLHWGNFTKFIGKNNLIITVMRILACLFAAFGVWSFFDRDMFSKLFLGFSFDYWPQERPVFLFFAVTLSIMGLFAFMSYHCMKLIG